MAGNLDPKTVQAFGEEWGRFDQASLDEVELEAHFRSYFKVFPWKTLPLNAEGFDLGCGSGRWAKKVADRVGKIHCIDASAEALSVAIKNLAGRGNVAFHQASVDGIPLEDSSMDFGYSLGVLHHVPDTTAGIAACVRKLKTGAPFLVYLYYAFDNRPAWFRAIWRSSDVLRRAISSMPFGVRRVVTDMIAGLVYFPFAKASLGAEKLGMNVEVLPLSAYRNTSFYTMRTDALDRFGTRLEQRFTRAEILEMMSAAGLGQITFSNEMPYWCAVGIKKSSE
jgi:ubiquinone/menaquinone biosynthesis C-methylase UbiE